MTLDSPSKFRNLNTLWAFVLVETLQQLGLKTAVICPGSRSSPLTIAFAENSQIEAIPVLDERSASFLALGLAQKSRFPVALVCTSGTAGANFYPAIIEAKISHIPLLVLTADRPPELQHCHAGQAIDQVKLYGNYANEYIYLGLPGVEIEQLQYLRQTAIYALQRTLSPTGGIVHLNIPFREPLAPLFRPGVEAIPADFFSGIEKIRLSPFSPSHPLLSQWQEEEHGIIIAGVDQSQNPWAYCRAIARLSQALNWVVLTEALSPIRNYAGLNPSLVTTYDIILRNPQIAETLAPKMVIQIGNLPTSKMLRNWLKETCPQRWILDTNFENLDPLHGQTTHLPITVEQLTFQDPNPKELTAESPYLQQWCQAQSKISHAINQEMQGIDTFLEGKVSWLLSQNLPAATPIFIANSMSVRNVEYFWMPRNSGIRPYFNRGANGIDGTLSTALGIAHRNQSSILLTGDLALLHDTNGFLFSNQFQGHLTILLINNNGGGIFEMLDIAKFEPPFEEFFAMPQNLDFAQLAATYNVEYQLMENWEQLQKLLNPLPEKGIRILEIPTNRKVDAKWLKTNLEQFATNLTKEEEISIKVDENDEFQ